MTAPKRDIINAHQAAMLGVLREVPHPISANALFVAAGLSRSNGMKQMAGLREVDLVTEAIPQQHHTHSPALWTISMAGRRALGDYTRKQDRAAIRAMAVAAPTHSFLGTEYTPPAGVYYRNNGNRHIASVGVQC